jgi:YbbR domain-containing protein
MALIQSILSFLRFNNKNWKVILLCIFAAAIFWIFNSLNKNYSASIDFPLVFDYDQESYVAVKALPDEIKLNVSGLGWDLFRKSAGLKVPPLRIPLENPSEVKKIVGATLPALFSGQMEGLQINFVITDTLHLQIDPKVRKRIKIKIDSVEQYVRAGYGISGPIVITPDTVWLEGPQSLVTVVPDNFLVKPDASNLDESFDESVMVDISNNLIQVNPSTVQVSIPVSKLIQMSDSASLTIINIPRGLKTVAEIDKIHFRYEVPANLQNSLVGQVEAELDLEGLPRGSHKLVPRLLNLPPSVRNVAVDTLYISY